MPSIFIITSLILTRASVMNPLTAKEQCWSFHLRNMWISLFCRFLLASLSLASLYNIQWQNSSQAYTCRERLGPRNISKTLLGHAWLMTFVKTKAFRKHYVILTCFSTTVIGVFTLPRRRHCQSLQSDAHALQVENLSVCSV